MRYLFCITFFFVLGFSARAADTLTTKLINSIYLEIVDTRARYYYLLESGSNPVFDSDEIKYEFVNNKTLLKDLPLKEFAEAIKNDTSKINWRSYNLLKARVVDKAHSPKYTNQVRVFKQIHYNTCLTEIKKLEDNNIIPVLLKKGMSEKQIANAQQRANDKYEDRPIEEKNIYIFSKPIFSKNRDYVLIKLNASDHGSLYVFKLTGGKWKRILKVRSWVS